MLKQTQPMKYTDKDAENFENAIQCYICRKNFTPDKRKNRDHNHYNGKYLGAACTKCNLTRRRLIKLPIFLHNGSKYDFHFIIKSEKSRTIDILPYNGENFRMLSFKGFKFLDSLAFLQSSLSQLSENLFLTDHKYPILKQTFLTKQITNLT